MSRRSSRVHYSPWVNHNITQYVCKTRTSRRVENAARLIKKDSCLEIALTVKFEAALRKEQIAS